MKKIFCYSLISLILLANRVQALEIVYPKTDIYKTSSDKVFFIGNTENCDSLTINSEKVQICKDKGFQHAVKLDMGDNSFEISDGLKKLTYKVIRIKKEDKNPSNTISYYKTPIIVETKEDNAYLRSTPVDYGINRLQSYQKGIKFLAIAQYDDFYKIQLARDDFAWLLKKNARITKDANTQIANIESFSFEQTKNKRIYNIKLTNKVPYILYDNKGLDLTIYNVGNYPFGKYNLRIKPIQKNIGFKSYYTNNNELIIETKNFVPEKNKPLSGLKVVVDAGHGGSELGAIGCRGEKEKDINLEISKKLIDELKKHGAEVFPTRTEDIDVSLSDRVEFTNNKNADVFISIHNNADADEKADAHNSGTSIYYFYPQSKELAKELLETITKNTKSTSLGVKQESFAVVRNTQCLSLLLELGYMIHPEDISKLSNPEYQDLLVKSIVQGLENYFK